MLASTVQFSRYGRSRWPHPCGAGLPVLDRGLGRGRPFPQDPTACSAREPLATGVPSRQAGCTSRRSWYADRITSAPLVSIHPETFAQAVALDVPAAGRQRQVLLRKEVIQPHLPVRLPCYDFVPIASPTFDGSLPYGLGHRLRVLPTFVT